MTPPVLPTPSLGNLAQDISGAAAGFVKGLRNEQERRRQAALDQALLQARVEAAKRPGLEDQLKQLQADAAARAYIDKYPELKVFANNPLEVINRGRDRDTEGLLGLRPRPPVPMTIENEPGKPVTGFVTPPAGATPGFTPIGPAQQTFAPGTPGAPPVQPGQAPVQAPQQPVAPPVVHTAPGQFTPTGGARVTPSYGYLSTPTPQNLDAANWAPGVMQGFSGVRDIMRTNKAAAAEAVPYLNALQIAGDAPAVGNVISSVIRALPQSGLSPAAQQFVQSFIRWRASRVFASGGKQLTGNEIREATAQYVPSIGEDDNTTMQRLNSMAADALSVLQATGRAWPQRRAELIALGAPDLGEFNPLTQTFSNQNVTINDLLNAGPVNQPGVVNPPQRSIINPLFDPRVRKP